MSQAEQPELARLTVELLSAYVSNNTVASSELPGLIEATRAALAGDVRGASEPVPQYTPAVSVEDSLASRDHIVSLIDGKPYKALKRHLTHNGLTPEEYKARYNLPADYPLVAPSYSEHRRKVAKAMGLGGQWVTPGATKAARAVKQPSAASDPIAKTSATEAPTAKVTASQQTAAQKSAVKAKKVTATKSVAKSLVGKTKSAESAKTAAPLATEQALPPEVAAVAAKSAAKSARKLALLKGVAAQAGQGETPASDAVSAPERAEPKPFSTGAGSVPAEALPFAPVKPAAKAKPVRKMARPKSESGSALQSAASAGNAPTPAETRLRRKLGVKFDSVAAATAPAAAASPAAKPKTERKARSGTKGGASKGPKAPHAAQSAAAKAAGSATRNTTVRGGMDLIFPLLNGQHLFQILPR